MLHCMDIVRAAVDNDGLEELREHEMHAIPLPDNTFAKKDKASRDNAVRTVGMDSMNKPLQGGLDIDGLLVWIV